MDRKGAIELLVEELKDTLNDSDIVAREMTRIIREKHPGKLVRMEALSDLGHGNSEEYTALAEWYARAWAYEWQILVLQVTRAFAKEMLN